MGIESDSITVLLLSSPARCFFFGMRRSMEGALEEVVNRQRWCQGLSFCLPASCKILLFLFRQVLCHKGTVPLLMYASILLHGAHCPTLQARGRAELTAFPWHEKSRKTTRLHRS